MIVLSLSPDPRALLNDLIDIAKIDRRITADERKLIDQIARDIKKYEQAVVAALEDNILTDKEILILNKLHKRVIENAKKVAEADNVKTSEERVILDRLINYLSEVTIK